MTVPRAVMLIELLAASAPSDVIVGAGTVLDVETAHQVILAGARFVVSPVLKTSVIELGHRYDVAVMPGCFTPTEILTAWEAGADVVKVFQRPRWVPGSSETCGIRCRRCASCRLVGSRARTPASGFRLAQWPLASALRSSMRRPCRAGRFDLVSENARHFIDAVRVARAPQPV